MFKTISIILSSTIFAFALNINTASKDDLMKIKGIGQKKAEAIIQYRKSHKIKSIEELKNIKGIGEHLLYNIKNNITKGKKVIKEKVVKQKEVKKEKTKKTSTKKDNKK